MSQKKLEKSELEYIKELLDSQTKNFISIGQWKQQIKVLEAQITNKINDNLQLDNDYKKNMEKIQKKYGEVSINLEDGSLTEVKKDK